MKALYARLFVIGMLMSTLSVTADDKFMFPRVEGKNLHGELISFPEVFASQDFNVIIVAFEQEQQNDVDTWLPALIKLETQRDDLRVMELPTIAKMNRLMRWVIYRGMRSGIKDSAARSRTVTLHIDKRPFKKALKIESERDIRLYLVDAKGIIAWETEGLYSSEKLTALTKQLPSPLAQP